MDKQYVLRALRDRGLLRGKLRLPFLMTSIKHFSAGITHE